MRLIFAVLVISSCSLQSDYVTPKATAPEQWSVASAEAISSQNSSETWWKTLHDPAIDVLVDAAFATNPTLAQAVAKVDEARAQVGMNRAGYFPVISGSGNVREADTKINGGGGGGNSSVVGSQGMIAGESRATALSPSLSWELDLFGRVRSSVDASKRRLDARTADAQGAKLSLSVQVTNTVLDWRACAHTMQVNRDEITSRQKTLALIRQKTAAGFTADVDVASVERDLAVAQGALSKQQETCARNVNALVELSGQPREVVMANLTLSKAETVAGAMPVPPAVAPKLPATILLTHPSVIAADRDAAAAWAEIGGAKAERFPKIDLSAALNYQWITVGGSTIGLTGWSLGSGIAATLFDAGKGAANVDVYEARYRQSAANLEATVRTTVKEVENALAAQQSAAERVASSAQSAAAAKIAFHATEAQWKNGMASLLEFEDARRQYATAQDNAIAAERDRATAWVGLISATANSITLTQSQSHEPNSVSAQ